MADILDILRARAAGGAAAPAVDDTSAPADSSPTDVWSYASARSEEMGIPVTLTRALIQMESGGNKDALGPVTKYGRAQGALQVMPGTMRDVGIDPDTADWQQKIDAGLINLRNNYDATGKWDLALAAHHAGLGAVQRAGGVPNTRDVNMGTPDFVSRVMGAAGNPASAGAPSGPRDILDILRARAAAASDGSGGDTPQQPQPDTSPDDFTTRLQSAYAHRDVSLLDRLSEGYHSATRGAGLGKDIVMGDEQSAAQRIAQGQRDALPQTTAQQEMAANLAPYQQAYKNAQGGDAIGPAINLGLHAIWGLASHPKEALGTVVEGLPGAVPMVGGMAAGGAAGSVIPGPGSVIGALVGGTAGYAATGIGNDFEQRVLQEAAKQGVDPRDQAALAPIIHKNWQEFASKAATKGLTTGAVMTVLNLATTGAASIGERAIVNEAKSLSNDLLSGAITPAEATARATALRQATDALNTVGARATRGAGVVTGETGGMMAGEAAGEVAAGDEINPEAIASTGALMLGQSVLGAALRRPLARITGVGAVEPAEASLARVAKTIKNIGDAPTVDAAIAEAARANSQTPAKAPEVVRPEPTAAERGEQAATATPDRMSALRDLIDKDAARQEDINTQRGYDRTQPVPGETPLQEGRLNDVMPQAAPRDMLNTWQAQTNEARASAGLDTKLHLQPGEENTISLQPTPMTGSRTEAARRVATADQGWADLKPMDPREVYNRLTVLKDMARNEGGDAGSLQVVPHPTTPGKLAIRDRAEKFAYRDDLQGNKTPAAPSADPVDLYMNQARKAGTEQSRAFVRQFDEGKITREDVQNILTREGQYQYREFRAPSLSYDEQGNPRVTGQMPKGMHEPITDTTRPMMDKDMAITPGARVEDYRGLPEGTFNKGGMSPEREQTIRETMSPPEALRAPHDETPPPKPEGTPEEAPRTKGRVVPDEAPPRSGARPEDYNTPNPKGERVPSPADMDPRADKWAKELPARTDNPVLRKLVEAGDKQGIANFLAEHPNPMLAMIGRYAQKNTHFRMLDYNSKHAVLDKYGKKDYFGYYHPKTEEVVINPTHAGNEWTVAHEFTHALTSRALMYPKNKAQLAATRKLEALYHYVRKLPNQPGTGDMPKRGGHEGWYGTVTPDKGGVHEMVSEGFTNRDFQDWLAKIPYGKKSAWSKFVQFVSELLGLQPKEHTALHELLHHGQRLMEEQAQAHPKLPTGSRPRVRGNIDINEPIINSAPASSAAPNTEAFNRWFNGSHVVDESGDPLVMYHGTRANFKVFEPGTGWFSSDAGDANVYGGMGSTGANVMPAYLAIKNPRVFQSGTVSSREIHYALEDLKPNQDGVLVMDGGRVSWAVVTRPEQIKSALGNRGTFDSRSPDILMAAVSDMKDATLDKASEVIDKIKTSEASQHLGTAYDGVLRALYPQGRGEEAMRVAEVLTQGMGEREMASVKFRADLDRAITNNGKATTLSAKARDLLQTGFNGKVDAALMRLTPEERWSWANAIDNGDTATLDKHPELREAADVIARMFREKGDAVQKLGTGVLQTLREHYFPHMWKKTPDADAQRAIYEQLSKRPFEGSKDFTKARIFDDIQAGLDAGYKPISDNPLDLVFLKMHEMDKYLLAHKTLQAMEGTEGVKLLRSGDRTPTGYSDIIGHYGNTIRGDQHLHYVARDDVAQVINNYLSPSLYHNKYVGSAFTGYMHAANTLNQFQLGMGSAFHAGFTSIEAVISHAAIGIKALTQGDLKGAAKYLGSAPAAWINNPRLGSKVIAAMMDSGAHPEMAPVLQGLEMAGFKWQMDRRFRTDSTQKMLESWRNGSKVAAVARSIPALSEQLARPILEYLVPRQKFGVFAELYNRWIETHPNATHEETRAAAQQVWNRVDSRLGQVVYDRLFMHNVTKNVGQMLLRAPGWTGGTVLEVGGGLKDLVKYTSDLATGKKPGGISDRAAYVLAMATVTGLTNAIMTAMFTGDSPQDWRDLASFRTGNEDEKGDPERFVLPTYAKDLAAYYLHPGKTVVDKAHPALAMIGQVARNRDYQGTEIRGEDDNIAMQIAQSAGFVAKQFIPFWMQGVARENEREGSALAKAGPVVGVMPAPGDYNKTAAQRLMSEYAVDRLPQGSRTSEERAKMDLRSQMFQALRRGDDDKAQELFEQGRESGVLGPKDYAAAAKQARGDPLTTSFGKLTYDQAKRVMDVASEDEREKLEPLLERKHAQWLAQHNGVEETAD